MLDLREKSKVVGAKQTKRALQERRASTVYIADDCEQKVVAAILELCSQQGVPVVHMETMDALGRACGVRVGAAVAALLEE